MTDEQRTKIWVDQFQTRLTLRIGAYLALFLVVLFNLLFSWRMWQEGPGDPGTQFVHMLRDYMPVWICLLALVPVMGWDAMRFTHRLVGPLMRFRLTLQNVAQGEPVRPMKLRSGDYLTELRDDFNQMLDSLQRRGLPVLRPTDPAQDEDKRTSQGEDKRTSA